MSDCTHAHTGSCSPWGVYLYVACMDCGEILAASGEGEKRWRECPGFDSDKSFPGLCKHCHRPAQVHYNALAARLAEAEGLLDRCYTAMCNWFSNEFDGGAQFSELTGDIAALRREDK